MAAAWEHFGEIANVAQLTGLDAVKLIGLIVKAASTARMHKKNCKEFALHLKLIGNLLQTLRVSELKKYPETREPLEQLEEVLRRSYILVNSCQDRSYLYLLAMGWNIVYQFRRAQNEIDRYLKIIPLISLVDDARVRERLEYIERDQREYTLDDEDRKVQTVIMNPNPSHTDTVVLKKSLSCSYPNLPFKEVIQKENEKLHMELQRSQSNLDVGECEVIQHLIEVTQVVASKSQHEQDSPKKVSKKAESIYTDDSTNEEVQYEKENSTSRSTAMVLYEEQDLPSTKASYGHGEWHSDLLGCCSEPKMCFKTFFFPCGTFSKIATVATNRHMTVTIFYANNMGVISVCGSLKGKGVPISIVYGLGTSQFAYIDDTANNGSFEEQIVIFASGEACNELMAYSLILSCCCYTCCIRRKLRKTFNITGGWCDDFLSHVMCCCCALVQELREVEMRGIHGPEKTKTSPPTTQWMEF